MSKAVLIFVILLNGIHCYSQRPALATDNLNDSSNLTFTVRMHKMETSCLSSPSDILSVTIRGDSSIVMLIPDGNYSNRELIVQKLIHRNLLKELQLLEIDLNNHRSEKDTYLIHFDGPITRGYYGTFNSELLLNWVEDL